MSDPVQRSLLTKQNLALGCGLILLLALCGWLLRLIPGRVLILGSRSDRLVTVTPLPASSPVSAVVPTLTARLTAARSPDDVVRSTETAVASQALTSSPAKPAGGWEQLNAGSSLPALSITALAVDPRNPEFVLAGTLGGGIYITRDGGQTWAASNTGLGKGTVGSIAFHPQDSDLVFIGLTEQGGVYKSIDGGRAWKPTSDGIDLSLTWGWTALVAIAASDPDVLYFTAANSGMYRSEDGGASWYLRSSECPQAISLVVDPLDSTHLFVINRALGQAECPSGVYESADGGATWRRLATDEPATAPQADWRNLTIAARDPRRMLAASSLGAFLTGDGGQTWQKVHEACEWAAMDPDNGALFCRLDGILWLSREGGLRWEQSGNLNVPYRLGSAPIAFALGSPKIYLGDEAVLQSTDGGASWRNLGKLGTARLRIVVDPSDPQRLYLSAADKPGKILRSQDGGKTWQVVLEGIEPDGRLTVDSSGVVIYPNPAGIGNGLFRSFDSGKTWEQFGQGHPLNAPWQLLSDSKDPLKMWLAGECGNPLALSTDGGGTFYTVESSPANLCQPILLADSTGRIIYIINWGFSYRSQDGGQTWTQLKDSGGIPNVAVVDPLDKDTVYLGSTHLGVIKSIDGGGTWQTANSGLINWSINDLVIDPTETGRIYAATDGGVFVSHNGGALWKPLGDELGASPMVYSIALDPGDPGTIYAVTPEGVYKFEQE